MSLVTTDDRVTAAERYAKACTTSNLAQGERRCDADRLIAAGWVTQECGEVQMTKINVRINERGLRIGDSHPAAKLTDEEVEQLFLEWGGGKASGGMSLGALAKKWGMSKSGVKGILDGRRRGQIGPTVKRPEAKKHKYKKVRVNLSLQLHHRAMLQRYGGSEWLAKKLDEERALKKVKPPMKETV